MFIRVMKRSALSIRWGGQAAKIPDAIDACINNSDGFFAFDLCHIKMYDYWNAFKTGFDNYLESVQK